MLASMATDGENQEMLTFIVTNASGVGASGRLTVTLPADSTLVSLHEAVASQARVVPGTFELRRTAGAGSGPSGDAGPSGAEAEGRHRLDDVEAYTRMLFEAGMKNKTRLW